jgi:uncharacterized membrane protein
MQMLPDWIPNIHPLVVHFPIAILIIAIFTDLLSLMIKKHNWIQHCAFFLYTIGTVAAMAAYLSGRLAADSVHLPPMANPVLNHHSDFALITVLFFIFYTGIRFIVLWKGGKRYILISSITLLFSLPGIYLIYETSEHGAELVYKHGVGIQKSVSLDSVIEKKYNDQYLHSQSGIIDDQNGSWRWKTGDGNENDLINNFHWLNGSVDSIKLQVTKPVPKSEHLKLEVYNHEMFVNRGRKLKSVQANLYVNLNDFDGTIKLVHHIQDKMNYDFVALESGMMRLGRLINGKIKIMDEKSVTFKDWLNLGVVGDGTHFRGYLNDKLYTHGHGPELNPGSVGLLIKGQGVVLIDKLEVLSLK